jgi:dipeptidyl aminopeptidase/acylaminoacyl peptidase
MKVLRIDAAARLFNLAGALLCLTLLAFADSRAEPLALASGAQSDAAGSDAARKSAEAPPAANRYQRPPKEITDILDSPPTPLVSLSPTREHLLLVERSGYPPIADLAAPMLRLAGLRINPETNGPHMAQRYVGLILQTITDNRQRRIDLPRDCNIGFPAWSPNGKHLAFTMTTEHGIELWVATVADATARSLDGVSVNAAYGDPVQWMPDSRSLLVQTIVEGRGQSPQPPRTPPGPTVEESSGRAGPVRTYQDLLQNAHDEELFDYYCRSQLVLVDIQQGNVTRVGRPAVFAASEPSPDGKHLLVVRNRRPYSYVLPADRFPKEIEAWDQSGNTRFKLASLPLEDRIPIDGVPTGPRSMNWRPTEPATLVWAEALDGGDPRESVPHRDRILTLSAPFDREPEELAKVEQRYAGILWGEREGLALLRDYDRDRRWIRTLRINADKSEQPELLWERSINDRYGDPGSPLMRPLPNGRRVMWQHESSIFLEGEGATPRGDRPLLDRFDLSTSKTQRLFTCDDRSYESVVALLADDGSRFITRHETPSDAPNYFIRSADGAKQPLTNFPDPMPQLRKITKQLVTYERDDGVQLSFTLYLPPDRKPDQRLPTIVWAYPREFNDPATAGQVSGSTNRFTTIGGTSHLFLLTQGYAILDAATMPVVGDPATANDTYVQQIVASARAAIDKAVELGVTDRDRVGVGGHSYGAFMTANLLAHSDLFRAGVARSGAYNRTLTPFGFQNERRTFWEAPEIYFKMSPFMVADKINEPILLIHGQADNNPGTFPIQSERLYQAIRGNGGTVRYVTLPHESHGYAARESVEHTLWEMLTWFDRHVKNAAPTGAPAQ